MRLTTSLSETHCNGTGAAPRRAADAHNLAHAGWMEIACGETLHTTHGRADACEKPIDAQVVQQMELGLYHVKER